MNKEEKIHKAWRKAIELYRQYSDLEGECPECEDTNFEIIEEPDINIVTYRCLSCGYEHSVDMVN